MKAWKKEGARRKEKEKRAGRDNERALDWRTDLGVR